MDDPWGDPWATDDDRNADAAAASSSALATVSLDMSAEPRRAHFAAEGLGKNSSSPRRTASVPWSAHSESEDAWGGWAALDSPGWGTPSNLRPLGRDAPMTPDPWRALERLKVVEVVAAERGGEKRDDESVIRSALDEDEMPRDGTDADAGGAMTPAFDENTPDIWAAADRPDETEGTATPAADEMEPSEDATAKATAAVGSVESEGREKPRQAPKVQKLVEMFDGLSKQDASPRDLLAAEKKATRRARAYRDALGEEPSSTITEAQQDDLRHAILESLTAAPGGDEHGTDASNAAETAAVADDETCHRPVFEAAVDAAKLDELFPSTAGGSVEPEAVPDVIIDDSFKAISERKAWYRISRFGSIRKHDAGDDDDHYVRVGWGGSSVREQTLNIVRRWLEEDSNGARTVLGRRLNSRSASIFNWDSDAPPVEIGELLKKDKTPDGPAPQPSGAGGRSDIECRPKKVTFSWSESMPTTAALSDCMSSATPEQEPVSPTTHKLAADAKAAVEKPLPLPLPLPGPPRAAAPQAATLMIFDAPTTHVIHGSADAGEDDDDWGEMVSSPTAPATSMVSMTGAPVSGKPSPDGAADVTEPGPDQPRPVAAHDSPPRRATSHEGDGKTPSIGSDHRQDGSMDGFERDSTKPLPPPPPASQAPTQDRPLANPTASAATATATAVGRAPRPAEAPVPSAGDEEIVASTLRDLPDLSYMLR
ncbi:hypothetical protein DCS_02725 [Drechmeria coniospora]|uniref:Uncharacterized protein n=1 Tax=Drechmeria coniospora TaxID=98403 RepID=A0A151GX24_DRECN|nr:hypothetical protein DCS_02725 [Drechmeria coniospora]KYK61582.1 hypothetical protein DCS_02725 [Drechmeria coniospora]